MKGWRANAVHGRNRRTLDIAAIARGGDGSALPLLESFMSHRPIVLSLALCVLLPYGARAQHFTSAARITHLPAPVPLDSAGRFQSTIARVGDDVFVGGQPTERALREMKAQGVTTVVNLRTPEEMKRSVSFDEAALVSQLGMKYVYIPMRGNSEFPYSPDAVTKFSNAVRESSGKVLLHCTIGWRASHLWAAYLIKERGIPVDEALANARAIGLMDEHRMGSNGRQPVEDLLGRDLPTLGHPHS
jgi:uncharacterized protein (TIGR01244 family)